MAGPPQPYTRKHACAWPYHGDPIRALLRMERAWAYSGPQVIDSRRENAEMQTAWKDVVYWRTQLLG